MKEKVIVGISGGVDSAVTAYQLLQAGYDVEGLFMFNWSEDEDGYCNAADDYQQARSVCEELGITLHQADFSKEYRERVFQYFLDEYAAGRTPNPDVLCNREIKFKEFLNYALRLGADKIATGHYAGVMSDGSRHYLIKAADPDKDQTYFLAAITEQALAHSLFPLHDLNKTEVRDLARQVGLPNYARKDSTGICFIGERPFQSFLANYLPAKPGIIRSLDHANREIGAHQGLMYYTLGQRKGLGIGGVVDAVDAPWYVVRKDMESNTLWVSQDSQHPALLSSEIYVEHMHWINGADCPPATLTARIRHRQEEQLCHVRASQSGILVNFECSQRAATPGQYLVLYRDNICLGGGPITETRTLDS